MKKVLSFLLSIVIVFTVLSAGMCVQAADGAVISVENTAGTLGSTVSVKISIKNNPGILAMAFCISYDKDAFEYVDYSNGYLSNYTVTNHADKGIVSFVSVENSDVAKDDVLLILNFKIKATAVYGDYPIVIKNNNPDKYGESLHNSFANSKEQYISVNAENGVISVKDSIVQAGDVNLDGNINNRDIALLMQYVNGYDVEVLAIVADVNKDGSINNKDVALLMQYVNGWDVKLG